MQKFTLSAALISQFLATQAASVNCLVNANQDPQHVNSLVIIASDENMSFNFE